jgi:hypothetical protein
VQPRRCRKCRKSNEEVAFVAGKNLCNPCKAAEARAKRAKDNPDHETGRPKRALDLDMDQLPTTDGSKFDFADRATLNRALSETLSANLGNLNALVECNRARLNSALKSKHATDVEKAENALRRSVDSQSTVLMKVIDKLELLEGLRRGADEAGKDVHFHSSDDVPESSIVECAPYEIAAVTDAA